MIKECWADPVLWLKGNRLHIHLIRLATTIMIIIVIMIIK